MTLPTYIGTGTPSETSFAWPAGHAVDDICLIGVEHGNQSASIATPSGFGRVTATQINAGAVNTSLTVLYKFATSTSEANVTIAFAAGGTQDHKWAGGVVYRGVNKNTPFHARTSSVWTPAFTTVFAPGIFTLIDDCMIVGFCTWSNDDAGPLASAPANTSLGSVSEREDSGTVTGNGGGLTIWDGTLASHGFTEMSTLTFSTSILGAQLVIALCPADKGLSTLRQQSRTVNTHQ